MDHPSRLGRALGILAGLVICVGVYLGLVLAPPDAVQGQVQRIMYLHVPSIVTAYLAFTVTCVASVLYLWKRDLAYDAAAVSSAEIGVLLTGITLATGCIWGKATWGVWWTWDARLTLTAILFTIYVGYLMLRAFAEEPEAAARYGAVLAVQWWRTLHQPSSILRPGGPSMDPVMLGTLAVNLAGLVLLYTYLLLKRIRLEHARHLAVALRLQRGRRG